jgi:hypothetical protein
VSEGLVDMTEKRKGKYRTAIILAAFALGLFLFTLYARRA